MMSCVTSGIQSTACAGQGDSGGSWITGSGQATLVTRDALGRSVSTSVPLYIDTRMLATGLSSYSIEAGVARRQFSVRSFDYDKRPAVTASMARSAALSMSSWPLVQTTE